MPDNKNVNFDTENLRVSDEEIEENMTSGKSSEDKIKAKVNDLVINKAAQERFQEIEAEKAAVTDIYIKDKRSGGTYNAAPADIGKKKDLAKSVAEIQRMQDSIILNYKDAIGDVHYSIGSDLSDAQYNAELRNRLKAHNDAYFTSMYMGVFGFISKEGVTIKSLFEIKGSMEALKAFNPNADMDKARLAGRLKDNIAASSKNHGVFYKAIMNPVSHYLESVSADSTSKGVATAVKNDDLDSLVMSPRMLAAMKVNFDEQYYYDTRRLSQSDKNYNEKMEAYKKQYDKAIEHVVAIAQNSGYDMSAIAEEERYIVGMKMINSAGDNPYNVIYRQTASMYGVRPVDMQGNPRMSNTSLFRGDFESVDGHSYTTGGSKRGAFEVSHRLSDNDGSLRAYKDELSRNGRQIAWMINYTKSDVCNLDPTQKKAAIQRLEEIMTQRKEDATMRLKIDLGISKSEAAKIYDDNFNRGYNKGKNTDMRYAFGEVEGIFDKNHMAIDGIDFCRELRYTAEKDVFRKDLGIELPSATLDSDGNYRDLSVREDILTELKAGRDSKGGDRYGYVSKSIDGMAYDMIDNHIKQMDAESYVDFLMHVGANMEQSYANRGCYSRHGESSYSATHDNELEIFERDIPECFEEDVGPDDSYSME